VLDYAKAHGWRSGENPAAWRGHLALILPKRQKFTRGHHPAMPYDAVPPFVAGLREKGSMAALALEFLVLTAARSGEVLGAKWDEFDLAAKVWTVPSGRMKAGIEHRVPLSPPAMAIIERMASIRTGDLVFASSATALRMLVPANATPHGFRSSFRDWAGNKTSFARELAEGALAHATGDSTERAYRRGDAPEKRRASMSAWTAYCGTGSNIVKLRPAV
jgi:integrase